MKQTASIRSFSLAIVAMTASGCASTGALLETPEVSLRNVSVTQLGFNAQTFVLDFDVINPNPFPLPIRSVSYGVELDGYRFVSGQTEGRFTVPASSDGAFAISVDVDLIHTAPQLMFIVRDGVYREIPYVLKGQFEVDIPFTNPVPFSKEGSIRLQSPAISADRDN